MKRMIVIKTSSQSRICADMVTGHLPVSPFHILNWNPLPGRGGEDKGGELGGCYTAGAFQGAGDQFGTKGFFSM